MEDRQSDGGGLFPLIVANLVMNFYPMTKEDAGNLGKGPVWHKTLNAELACVSQLSG